LRLAWVLVRLCFKNYNNKNKKFKILEHFGFLGILGMLSPWFKREWEKAGGVAPMVKPLSSRHEALSLNPSIIKKE
jgi:hypothetical protein